MTQQRILVIGSGFAGTWAALAARRAISQNLDSASPSPAASNIEVVVIAPDERLVARPRLHEANPSAKMTPLGDLFRATGVRFIKGTVDTIRTAQREVEMVDQHGARSAVSYDRLVLAAGSHLIRPQIPGLAEYGFNIDTIDQASRLESHLRHLASLPNTLARNTVVVCGGGFTGIELVTSLPSRMRALLGPDADIRVVVVDSSPEVGKDLGPGPRPVIIEAFRELGVETKLGSPVAAFDATGVTTADGERIESLTAVWTAGVRAGPLGEQVEGERDKLGRLHVDSDLRVPSVPDVFVAGDAAVAATDDQGNSTLMSCQHAMPLGRNAGHNAAADLLEQPLVPYSQPRYGTCLDLGPDRAVVTRGWQRQVVHSGGEAKAVKTYVNETLIAPPSPIAEVAFAAANPLLEAATV